MDQVGLFILGVTRALKIYFSGTELKIASLEIFPIILVLSSVAVQNYLIDISLDRISISEDYDYGYTSSSLN